MESVGKCSAETLGIDKLRTLLVTSAKESAFRKVVQATMVRDRQHGPVIGEIKDSLTVFNTCMVK